MFLKTLPDLMRFLEIMARAKEIDPEAFVPVMMPHYSGEQLNRQVIAQEKAKAEMARRALAHHEGGAS